METSHHILLHIALILIFTKIIASLSVRLKQPPIIGFILFGLIMGPKMLNIIQPDVVIEWLSQVGVLLLLFQAGLETDLKELKKQGKVALLATAGGVIIPFFCGYFLSQGFFHDTSHALFTGTMLVATSVGVTVMTLLDMKSLRTKEGTTIMGAAILDDIIGIIILTFVVGFSQKGGHIGLSIGKIFGFFILAFLAGNFLIRPIIYYAKKLEVEFSLISVGLGLAFIFSWLAKILGVAEITGAYLAGLFLGQTTARRIIYEGIEEIGQIFFVAIFFVNIGLQTDINITQLHWGFTILFILFGVLSKILGAGSGAFIGGYNWRSSLTVGAGMVPRGEVVLVIASLALQHHVIEQYEFSNVVLLVLATAIITPVMLKGLIVKTDSNKL